MGVACARHSQGERHAAQEGGREEAPSVQGEQGRGSTYRRHRRVRRRAGAFTELLGHLPGDTGLAFALVQHLDPTHESNLAEILTRATPMKVRQVSDGMPAKADHVYIIPPDAVMRVRDGAFVLSARGRGRAPVLSVDILLDSLAEQYGDRAIGVVLSGAASDGVKGLGAIESAGGITIVQDPDTAAYRSMPASAIAAGVADSILPVEQIAAELVRLARHPYLRATASPTGASSESVQERELEDILIRVHEATGVDLTHYKRATLRRRVERRMAMRKAESYTDYLRVLQQDEGEVAALFSEVLVRVTSFFRDPLAFEALAQSALPGIVGSAKKGSAIRVWVAGCATGQEAYSVAMLLVELLEKAGSSRLVQVFASDLREGDLEYARRGLYPLDIESEVSAARLKRFFTKAENGYQVNKSVREACVFARHDVASDPPFARLDLVTCRN
ncbi:MAG: chemotaxis protein CheB, partial [Coriobacteriia bacterium]|nr:chemotaxis protein CheB [Coriobacteriia bacterium]